ncbi:UNVERIFIED_CONTAM: hypothetical protein K2H54_055303 [Gekko kuhli]
MGPPSPIGTPANRREVEETRRWEEAMQRRQPDQEEEGNPKRVDLITRVSKTCKMRLVDVPWEPRCRADVLNPGFRMSPGGTSEVYRNSTA